MDIARKNIVKELVGKKITAITISNMGHFEFWTNEPREAILFTANADHLFDQDRYRFFTGDVSDRTA